MLPLPCARTSSAFAAARLADSSRACHTSLVTSPAPAAHDEEIWSSRWGDMQRYAPPVCIAAAFLAMLVPSWGRWPDVLVDFGHELYIPWQLDQGKALVRDIAGAATGPLPPYLNAALFALFGPGLWVLVAFNLALLAALTALLYSILRTLADVLPATVACLVFLGVFAFGNYLGTGNYNYVTPYSHGVSHGLFLSVLGIWLLQRFATRRRARLLAGAGLCLGLVFLAKAELFLALLAAMTVGVAAVLRGGGAARNSAGLLLLFATSALAAPAAAFLLLWCKLPAALALDATLIPWLVIGGGLTKTPFYLQGSGLDDPAGNLGSLLLVTGGLVVFLGLAAACDRLGRRFTSAIAAVTVAAAVLVALVAWLPTAVWFQLLRPLPLAVALGAMPYLWRALIGPLSDDHARLTLGAIWSTFALLLLAKMILNVRVYHYGFALAMPATMLCTVWLTGSIHACLRGRGGAGGLFRAAALGAIAAFVLVHVRVEASVYAIKVVPVGQGRDWLGVGGSAGSITS